ILTGLCGGVIQNTPYIGHPAYKAMGARAGYTLATGVAIGAGAALGALSVLVSVLPEAAIAPILVFIGLEITAQGFKASPPRHGAAVALAFVPVAAAVVLIETGGLLAALGASPASLTGEAALAHQTLRVLGNGFILTALLWGWTLVAIIERRLGVAGALCAFASLVTLFGVIHSPLADGALFWPWAASAALPQRLAGAYGAVAAICWLAAWGAPRTRCRSRPTARSSGRSPTAVARCRPGNTCPRRIAGRSSTTSGRSRASRRERRRRTPRPAGTDGGAFACPEACASRPSTWAPTPSGCSWPTWRDRAPGGW